MFKLQYANLITLNNHLIILLFIGLLFGAMPYFYNVPFKTETQTIKTKKNRTPDNIVSEYPYSTLVISASFEY